ncbi:MAG: DNA topoisomerase, partial [Candidatus Aenigmatarchaeota archaeon]
YAHFGYSPKFTLDIAQKLYEQALISYPRTSSQKLPQRIGYRNIIINLSKQGEYAKFCKNLLSKDFLRPHEGEKEDPAHPAIFPIGNKPGKLSRYQKNIYDLIVRRFLACFSDPALKEYTKIIIDVNGERFLLDGVKVLKKNWMEIYGKTSEKKVPIAKKGDEIKNVEIKIISDETKPPKRYNQATILKKLEDLGLGTKGTRALILQTLYDRGYIEDKDIKVTELGSAVVSALEKYCPEILSVELTRMFDEEMEKIQEGKISKEKVIEDAKITLTKILNNFKKNEKEIGRELLKGLKKCEILGKCKCGGDLKIIKTLNGKGFVGCSNYPKCDIIYPLPRNAKIEKLGKICEECKTPIIRIIRAGKKSFEMCLDPKCKTKDEWNKTKKS